MQIYSGKLHGSICFSVMPKTVDFETLFVNAPNEQAERLFNSCSGVAAPILFPWEVMNDKGIVEEGTFSAEISKALYPLFRSIWERAGREIHAAQKISFIGLSMHPFLKDGLKYLFEGKTGNVEIVLANPLNSPFIPGKGDSHWSRQPPSPGYVLNQVLNEVAPSMNKTGGEIRLIQGFEEFIKTQMRPVSI
jgi:hypothetical protein